MYLMCGDERVLHFVPQKGIYDVLNIDLLPYPLKGCLVSVDRSSFEAMYETTDHNKDSIMSFVSKRVLALSRANAKKILNILNLSQMQDDRTKVQVAMSCRAVSVIDNYWIAGEDEKIKWDKINIRRVSLSEVIAQIALHGTSLTLQSKDVVTPELTTQGAYAKCWKRDNGSLWLYKRGDRDSDYESHVEVCVSRILDKTNLRHVKYEDATSKGKYCCRCKCMSDDNKSILDGTNFYSYCIRNGIDPVREAHRIDPEMMYGMHIIDYLVSNIDRHSGNWGFYYDSKTTQLLGCHPLFDHNNAFDRENMKTTHGGSCKFFDGKTMKQTAEYSLRHCNFQFTERIKRSDFMNDVQYKSFTQRAKFLGIKCI